MLKIEFETDNAAFEDNDIYLETVEILERITRRIANGETSGNVRDTNGNRIGIYHMD